MLEQIGDVKNIPAFIQGVKDKKKVLMGFGHRVYKNFDPRARILKQSADEVLALLGRDDPPLERRGRREAKLARRDERLLQEARVAGFLERENTLWRRSELARESQPAEERLERGPLSLDLKRFSVTWNGIPVPLTLTEFWMVHALAKHPGHVKDREQLMHDANLVVDDATITSHVKRIRRKFERLDPGFGAIETVYGLGYRWSDEAAR